jgi:hypothetical protein
MTTLRDEKLAEFEAAWEEAYAAGLQAGNTAIPRPMTIVQRANPMDDASPVTQEWHEPEGMCGFAWVRIRPGTSSFAKWLVKTGKARAAYQGGIDIWIKDHGQSVERKEAHARAVAAVFRSRLGIKAYADSRLD